MIHRCAIATTPPFPGKSADRRSPHAIRRPGDRREAEPNVRSERPAGPAQDRSVTAPTARTLMLIGRRTRNPSLLRISGRLAAPWEHDVVASGFDWYVGDERLGSDRVGPGLRLVADVVGRGGARRQRAGRPCRLVCRPTCPGLSKNEPSPAFRVPIGFAATRWLASELVFRAVIFAGGLDVLVDAEGDATGPRHRGVGGVVAERLE